MRACVRARASVCVCSIQSCVGNARRLRKFQIREPLDLIYISISEGNNGENHSSNNNNNNTNNCNIVLS